MDLRTGTVSVRATVSNLEGPPAVGPQGVAWAATIYGLLVGAGPTAEVGRVALSPQPLPGEDAGATSYYRPSPPVLVDKSKRVAFVRGDGTLGVVSPSGQVSLAGSTACLDPTHLVPAGPKRFLVACRSGTLKLYGQ